MTLRAAIPPLSPLSQEKSREREAGTDGFGPTDGSAERRRGRREPVTARPPGLPSERWQEAKRLLACSAAIGEGYRGPIDDYEVTA